MNVTFILKEKNYLNNTTLQKSIWKMTYNELMALKIKWQYNFEYVLTFYGILIKFISQPQGGI
jgi:hypothetical protein